MTSDARRAENDSWHQMANPRRRGRSPWLEMTNPRTSSSPVTRSGDEAAHPVPSRDGGRAGSGCASNVPS